MSIILKLFEQLIYGLILFFLISTNAFAYLDPGTGSYFFQIAIAFILGGLYSIKIFWNKIANVFKNIFSKDKKSN